MAKPKVKKPSKKVKKPSKMAVKYNSNGAVPFIDKTERHPPPDWYKSKYWRAVRQNTDTDATWAVKKAFLQSLKEGPSRGLQKSSKGDQVYGKTTGAWGVLQQWVDKVRKYDLDPHYVNFGLLAKKMGEEMAYHYGVKDVDNMVTGKKGERPQFMARFESLLAKYHPEMKKMSKKNVHELVKSALMTIQFGPDGRAK